MIKLPFVMIAFLAGCINIPFIYLGFFTEPPIVNQWVSFLNVISLIFCWSCSVKIILD